MATNEDEIRENIKHMAKMAGLSPSALAHKARLAASTVNKFLNSAPNYVISKTSLDKLAEAAGLNSYEDFVIHQLDIPIRVVGEMRDGSKISILSDSAENKGYEAPSLKLSSGMVAMKIDNDNLKPVLKKGDMVYYIERASGIEDQAIDNRAVIETVNGNRYIGILKQGSAADTYHLISLNQAEEPILDVKLKWAAKIAHIALK